MGTRSALDELGRGLMSSLVASPLVPRAFRASLLRGLGADVGRASIAGGGYYGRPRNISVGEGTYINHGVVFDTGSRVSIGRDCRIAMGVLFCTGTHELGPSRQRAGRAYSEPITVGDGVWIGARATILPGVTIGDGVMIAPGAVVREDCEPDAMYGGVPARKIRDFETRAARA